MRAMVVGLTMAACSAAGSAEPAPVATGGPTEDASVADPCRISLLADPALRDDATSAAARWSKASGCEFPEASSGVTIRTTLELWELPGGDRGELSPRNDGTGSPLCGATVPEEGATWTIWVSLNPPQGCGSRRLVISHELFHVLAETNEHAPSGLGRENATGIDPIDEATLQPVCSARHCAAFAPER